MLAQQELNQVEKQELTAEIRQQIAEKDLEIHEKNMEQADELQEFYKDKFTNLGLYNYLSTTLNRLYHEAYNMASSLAKLAEQAYNFERDDNTVPFIANDNWQADRAGLLAGERLLLQLQRMEKTYLENHTRNYEITQSFSLALLNPLALVSLKQTSSCTFKIDEIMFDLFYPGQYKRLIKSVRLSIPCVTGPYTNVSAKLTLISGSKVRKAATTNPDDLIVLSQQPASVSIATSKAQNDGGLFEFNFRDERYLPFEGAGAVSEWKLELPSKIRSFDYDTISDVIIHLSYTAKDAKDNGTFKGDVEDKIVNTLTSGNGLYRLFSLRHEFPNAFHKLLNPTGEEQVTEFEVTRQHFPYFLADKELKISEMTFYRQPKDKTPIETFTLMMNPNVDEDPIKKWTLNASGNGLNQEELDDILILLKYQIPSPFHHRS